MMSMESVWKILGWIGNGFFFSRFFLQWIASERVGRSLAPAFFWWCSLAGSLFLGAYTLYREEPVLLLGYVITAVIYLRNLWLVHGHSFAGVDPRGSAASPPWALMGFFGLGWIVLLWLGLSHLEPGHGLSPTVLVVGVVGQGLWSSRFLIQWWFSERRRESHFPPIFWWMSLAGNTLLLIYAGFLGDPIWIAGLLLGPLVQIRNLMLLRQTR